MDTLTAKPWLLKQANLSLIRKAVKTMGTATRAEIARDTKISTTTVRSLLAEMEQNGEIESVGHDASSGGRKAERYRFKPERYYGVAICLSSGEANVLLVNICGEILETTCISLPEEEGAQAMLPLLDELTAIKEIKSIGVGVPGIVEDGCYWRKCRHSDQLLRVEIGKLLADRYGVPVVLENDLNATALGFGRCYENEFPDVNHETVNMAYLYFEKGCVSAGFIVDGRVVRGYHNFAGEIGLVPLENGRLLDECMAEPMDDTLYAARVAKVIGWICGILNPRYVTLSGPALRKSCIGSIGDELSAFLPRHMFAEVLYSPDMRQDYHNGMAYLTAGRMFEDIQLVKEQP